jgi:phospholipid/cholesterol/gamma-HCH transport system ATP-binding protein
VFQNPDHQIFAETVRDEIVFGPRNLGHSAERIEKSLKLVLEEMDLSGMEEDMPFQLSRGQRQRLAVASVLAMEPAILIIDEPSSGLDPLTALRLDNLILELRENFGTTIVLISHELASILGIGTNSVYLDPQTHTMIATGNPKEAIHSGDPRVRHFLTRGEA